MGLEVASPSLLGRKTGAPRKLYWAAGRQQAMRDGPWKYVRELNGQKPAALYNLEQDRGERTNLAKKEAGRLAAMKKDYSAWQKDVASGATRQPPVPANRKK